MTKPDTIVEGSGEARYRQRRRKKIVYYTVSGVLAGFLGYFLAKSERGEGSFVEGDIANLTLDPAVSLVFAAAMIIALLVVPLWGYSQIDEHAMKNNLVGMAAGCMAVISGYPAWAVLSMGGWIAAPTAFGIFLLCFAVMTLTFGVMKLRS